MTTRLILASGSSIRLEMIENAGVDVDVARPNIDEETIKTSMISESAKPRDIADALAEYKARKISLKNPDAVVLGSDQVLSFEGTLLSKPNNQSALVDQLQQLRGKSHDLFSAAVIYENAKPVWRSVAHAKLHMRDLTDTYIEDYITRNWDQVRNCVGGYQLEAEGARLFTRIEGDYFTVLGMPLLEVLNYLTLRGMIDG